MKRILFYAALAGCIIPGCKPAKKTSQAGVYKLEKQMVSGGGKDSVYARSQVKIYTDDHFIYAGMAPDSSVGFGVGYYNLDTGNRIAEKNIYSSRALDSIQEFTLKVSRTNKGYTQVIPNLASLNGVKYSETEVYSDIPSNGTSVLDGLWKLDSSYTVKGKDTTKQPEVQYKAFQGGHFMFVHRYPLDPVGSKYKNGFGYGEFTLKNDTLSETEQMTSHPALMNHQFAIKITFRGDDVYRQVITDNKTHERSVEIYGRLK
jgi:hypothetical protein